MPALFGRTLFLRVSFDWHGYVAYYVSAAKLITFLQNLVMIIADLVNFNRELLQRLKEAGVKLEDYRYCDIYRDYKAMQAVERRRKVIILSLAEKYGLTDRQVYNIVNHLETPIP